MTRFPIRSEHLRCKDGALISILPLVRRLDTSQEDEAYIVDPPVRLRAIPEDPAVQARAAQKRSLDIGHLVREGQK